jgi:hypothetical protein
MNRNIRKSFTIVIPGRTLPNCWSPRWLWFLSIRRTCLLFLEWDKQKTGELSQSTGESDTGDKTSQSKPGQSSNRDTLRLPWNCFPISFFCWWEWNFTISCSYSQVVSAIRTHIPGWKKVDYWAPDQQPGTFLHL